MTMDAKTVTVGGEQVRLEPFSGRKFIRVVRTVERIAKGIPDLQREWAKFTRELDQAQTQEMDRATARSQFGPEPLLTREPVLDDGQPVTGPDGDVLVRVVPMLDDHGRPVLGPDPLAHMTDQDWAASGNVIRLPRKARTEEKIAAILPAALDLAEEQVLRLLALLAMSNSDLDRYAADGSLNDRLAERTEQLLSAPWTDLLELAVAAGELADEQYTTKIRRLGDRLPNALRLFGMTPSKSRTQTTPETTSTSSGGSSTTKPTSSTGSPERTAGTNPPLSEPAGVSSPA